MKRYSLPALSGICLVILLSMSHCSSSASNNQDCSKVHDGTFIGSADENGSRTIVIRKGTRQSEITQGTTDTIYTRIEWLNPCEYRIYHMAGQGEMPDELTSYAKDHAVTIKIDLVTDKYYVFTGRIEGIDETLKDTLFWLK